MSPTEQNPGYGYVRNHLYFRKLGKVANSVSNEKDRHMQ